MFFNYLHLRLNDTRLEKITTSAEKRNASCDWPVISRFPPAWTKAALKLVRRESNFILVATALGMHTVVASSACVSVIYSFDIGL
jgi:hypothetical protein